MLNCKVCGGEIKEGQRVAYIGVNVFSHFKPEDHDSGYKGNVIGDCDFCGSEDVEVQEYKNRVDFPLTLDESGVEMQYLCRICANIHIHGSPDEQRIMQALAVCTNAILAELRKGKP